MGARFRAPTRPIWNAGRCPDRAGFRHVTHLLNREKPRSRAAIHAAEAGRRPLSLLPIAWPATLPDRSRGDRRSFSRLLIAVGANRPANCEDSVRNGFATVSNYPHPAVRVITRFDGRPFYVELPGPPDPEVQQIGDLGARRKALEQELRALQKTINELQAALKEASDTNVVEDFLQGIGVQDDPVDDIQAAIARASQRMKEIQEELRAISEEIQALLQELQAREKEHEKALERKVGGASEVGDAAGAEPVRTTVSDAVGPYGAVTVEVTVFPPPPASRARGAVSAAHPDSDVVRHR